MPLSDVDMAILERLRLLTTKLGEAIDEVSQGITDLLNSRFEAVKVRYERCRGWYREFRSLFIESRRYLVRVELSANIRQLYERIFDGLRDVSRRIVGLARELSDLATENVSVADEWGAAISRALEHVRASISTLSNVFSFILDYRARAIEELDHGYRSLEDAMTVLDSLNSAVHSDPRVLVVLRDVERLLREAVERCETLVEDVKLLAERG